MPSVLPTAKTPSASRTGYPKADGLSQSTTLAAPIVDVFGTPIAAIGIIDHTYAMTEQDLHHLAPFVIDTARTINSNAGAKVKQTDPATRPIANKPLDTKTVCRANLLLGRSPALLSDGDTIVCIDVLAPTVLFVSRKTGKILVRNKKVLIGALTTALDGSLVLADQRSVFRYQAPENFEQSEKIADLPRNANHSRFNCAAIDPTGRYWFGMMDLDDRPKDGDLWYIAGGELRPVGLQLTMPSGLAFCTLKRRSYVADSEQHTILAIEMDENWMVASPPVLVAKFDPNSGKPDALCVDSRGDIWITIWDGWRVDHLSSNGHLM